MQSSLLDIYSVRAETIIDDGVQCVVEWTLVVTEKGYAAGRVAQSGGALSFHGKYVIILPYKKRYRKRLAAYPSGMLRCFTGGMDIYGRDQS